MSRRGCAVLVIGFAFLFTGSARAETLVAKHAAETNHFVALEKITVGPDDQYHGAVSPDGKTLVFTHKADLVPHLQRQDLQSGEVVDLLALSADSEEPTIGGGGLVAFTYYKFNARGDICWIALPEKPAKIALPDSAIHCFRRAEGDTDSERSNPFWRGPKKIGYVVRDIRTQATRIMAQDLETGVPETLVEGRAWSPAMKSGGRYLFFNELVSGTGNSVRRVLRMKDLQTSKVRSILFSLPGLSGFPAVSDDESYVYFSHYLNDTNGDNVIDGADNSVVFRMPISEILAAPDDAEVFPEQLTSVESNCSFPRSFEASVYVTCAFQGSLDIYRMPLTGIVPAQWDERLLINAHETSRSYQERILLLDTMKYRLKKLGSGYDQRLMVDHILSDDTAAARYYLGRLQNALDPKQRGQRDFYRLLNVYLEAREQKKSQPSPNEVTPEFREQMAKFDSRISGLAVGEDLVSFQQTLRGMIATFLDSPRSALPFLQAANTRLGEHAAQAAGNAKPRPLERELFFELAAWTLPRVRGQSLSPDFLSIFREMMVAPELTEEEHIYYAFELLSRIKDGAAGPRARITVIERLQTGISSGPVATLLQSEIAALRLIESPDDAIKVSVYQELDKLMSGSKDDYFLRKALYIRAILNFADAAEFKYLEFIANVWLRYTGKSDTEFAYAREVYANADLDDAFAAFSKSSYQLAASFFYSSLSLTDDLESHDGYVRSMVLFGQRKGLDERYQYLKTKGFIDDNMKFVSALLLLIDAGPELARDRKETKPFDKAIDLLERMGQDRDSPIRFLLEGYCRLEVLRRTAEGYVFDDDLFDGASRDLLLAYDLGRDDDRIKASALMDLGLLHQRAQNHGLATRYLGLREKLGFTSEQEEAGFRWAYAQSLYYDHQPDKAIAQIALALKDAPSLPSASQTALKERRAFFLMVTGRMKDAASAYADLLGTPGIGALLGDRNLARAEMSQGYCLLKLKREGESMNALHSSLDLAVKLPGAKKGGDRLVDFEPIRIQLIDYGLLSRQGTISQRIAALEKRSELLPSAKGLLDGWGASVVQNRLALAKYYSLSGSAEAGRTLKMLDEAVSYARDFGDTNEYLGNTTFRPAVDALVYGIEHPEVAKNGDVGGLRTLVENCLKAYDSPKVPQPVLDYQSLKLQLLWAAYLKRTAQSGGADVSALFASDLSRRVQQSGAEAQWQEIQKLRGKLGA